jgi:hypothetical protein
MAISQPRRKRATAAFVICNIYSSRKGLARSIGESHTAMGTVADELVILSLSWSLLLASALKRLDHVGLNKRPEESKLRIRISAHTCLPNEVTPA